MPDDCPVTTTSMIPALLPGDNLDWKQAGASELNFGDVILYLKGSSIVAHRFLYRRRFGGRTTLICKGDALPHRDAPVPEEALLGCVTRVSRNGRFRNLTRGVNLFATFRMIVLWFLLRMFPWPGSQGRNLKNRQI